jgi:hypothetical protein
MKRANLIVTIVTLSLTTPAAAPQSGSQGRAEPGRVVAASNVRVRVEPSVEVRIAATLPLGTNLVELGTTPDGQWVHVRTPAGIEGWISAPLTRPVPPGQRDRVLESIAQSRASRGGFGFVAAVELIDLIEDLQGRTTSREIAARLALFRLEALRDAAQSGSNRPRPESPSIAAWYDRHASLLVFNEPGGMWMLRPEAVVAEHDRHRGTPVAQQIAWFAVANGLPGECEGDVPCHVAGDDRLLGLYLREYPAGTFVGTSLRRLLQHATDWRAMMDNPKAFSARDCDRLKAPLGSLLTAVANARPPGYAAVLHTHTRQALAEVGSVCRK